MIKPIQAIIYILRGNLVLDDKVVPVIKRNYPLDKTPCVNIDDSASVITVDKKRYNIKDNEGVSKEYLRVHRRTVLNIHCWIDSEQQREDLTNQINDLFNMAYLDNYQFCTQYNKETSECANLETECPTITQGKHLYKSSKQKCPQPLQYGYENIFTRYDLIKSKFDLRTPYSADIDTTKPPTLHSIYKLDCEYYDYTLIGGITPKKLVYYGKTETED